MSDIPLTDPTTLFGQTISELGFKNIDTGGGMATATATLDTSSSRGEVLIGPITCYFFYLYLITSPDWDNGMPSMTLAAIPGSREDGSNVMPVSLGPQFDDANAIYGVPFKHSSGEYNSITGFPVIPFVVNILCEEPTTSGSGIIILLYG
jgi:hypothetical protein